MESFDMASVLSLVAFIAIVGGFIYYNKNKDK